MKNLKLLSALIMLIFVNQSHGQANSLPSQNLTTKTTTILHALTFGYFRDKTNVTNDMKQILDAHPQEVQAILNRFAKQWYQHGGNCVTQEKWLPGYFIKNDHTRYKNAQRLCSFIKQHNLENSVSVPTKYLYLCPTGNHAWNLITNNYLVIAEEVKGSRLSGSLDLPASADFIMPWQTCPQEQFLLDKFPALKKIKAIYFDLHPANIVVTDDDTKVAIIDTDSVALRYPMVEKFLLMLDTITSIATRYVRNYA